MKQETILDAMGLLPDALLEEAELLHNAPILPHRKRPKFWLRGLIAAILGISLALSAVAVYQRWRMPKPSNGFQGSGIQPHTVQTYPVPATDIPFPSQPAPTLYSDGWFVAQAQMVLEAIQLGSPEATALEVVRQSNLWWNREEVEVIWKQEAQNGPSVKFDARSGCLIGITNFGTPEADGPMLTDEEALKTAEAYYDALPYARGYTFRHVEKICDTAWMYSFDRPISVEMGTERLMLQNDYEQVRITINPCTGRMELSNCFYVPLLDDHAPGELPLTEEQAVSLAEQSPYWPAHVAADEIEAEIKIVLPSSLGMVWEDGTETGHTEPQTAPPTQSHPYSDVTRLAWALTLRERPDSEDLFENETVICVDLYTGEILSVDSTR